MYRQYQKDLALAQKTNVGSTIDNIGAFYSSRTNTRIQKTIGYSAAAFGAVAALPSIITANYGKAAQDFALVAGGSAVFAELLLATTVSATAQIKSSVQKMRAYNRLQNLYGVKTP